MKPETLSFVTNLRWLCGYHEAELPQPVREALHTAAWRIEILSGENDQLKAEVQRLNDVAEDAYLESIEEYPD